ncbi:MAG: carboxypeptidase-like regulatory domain-containing protein [Terracidiphilus sp.]
MLRKSSLVPDRHLRMRFTLAVFALFLMSLGAPSLFAQTDTGNIAGTVTDTTGAVIPGANILATNTDNGLELSAVSGGMGEFNILAVPRGNYKVTATANGFQKQSASITVMVTSTQTVSFQLSPAGASTTVQVTGSAPLVDTSDATIGDTISGPQVAELPLNGRNFSQLALMTPGVTRGAYGDVASGGGSANMTETMRNNESGQTSTPRRNSKSIPA